ncbi:MAG: hypothetical protein Q8876_00020 [Bacillota bacterium]|nr:hypothetical protein [Bacillota bacterium]
MVKIERLVHQMVNIKTKLKIIYVSGAQTFSSVVCDSLTFVLNRCGFKAQTAGDISLLDFSKYNDDDGFIVTCGENAKIPEDIYDKTLVIIDSSKSDYMSDLHKYDKAVIPFNREALPENVEVIKYAVSEIEADLTAKNIQELSDVLKFEILGTGIIGRIRIPRDSRLTVDTTLAIAGALLISGVSMSDMIDGINAI